jgi:hypothetical protein
MAIYLASLPLSARLNARLCWSYRVIGGIVVFAGSATSIYLVGHSGDQGGIAAYFFQMAVIAAYVLLLIFVVALNWFLGSRNKE